MKERILIYQVLPRLYGNRNERCVENGSLEENGCGKMGDFTQERLEEIKRMGFNHIWYTGLLEHATQTDYTAYGIQKDHPDVVKGRAGSPYAVKDYYDIDPDLAENVAKRFEEFNALLERSHRAGLKVVMDFIPNHVARQYVSDNHPEGVVGLGDDDDTSQAFSPQNNFYYLPGLRFHAPVQQGEGNDCYEENPAKATGNDRFDAWPSINDWYETVKLNYGVDYCSGGRTCFNPIPDTWKKMTEILCFWSSKGIDAFRCDMAEMVPCEFWAWAIPVVKASYPDVRFIAEVYNPARYRNYIWKGKFDYLYDKVGLYDTLRGVMCGYRPARDITSCWQQVDDIKEHMLYFLENHDEQRVASDYFAGDARKGCPAMIVLSCMGVNPVMVYFGQELGEPGMDAEGFSGKDGRTTIFDYWSMSSLRRWIKQKNVKPEELQLRAFYVKLLNLCNGERALREGDFFDLMYVNGFSNHFDDNKCYAFLRKKDNELILVCANFDAKKVDVEINIPSHAFDYLDLPMNDSYNALDLLSDKERTVELSPEKTIKIDLPACGGVVLKVQL